MQGRNTEAALWFSTKEPIDVLVTDETLDIELLDPRKFEAGLGNEPKNEITEVTSGLGLATLQRDNTLDLTVDAAANIQDLFVRITNDEGASLSCHFGSVLS